MASTPSSRKELITRHLACPECQAQLRSSDAGYQCAAGHTFEFRDDVFLTRTLKTTHYFDTLHSVMQSGNEEAAIWDMCYSRQSEIAASIIRSGDVVVDVGCGPAIHFERPRDCVLIGVDPSFESIRANRSLDVRIFGAANALPMRADSVDRMFFFYSIHHMIGDTVAANTANLRSALVEARRVMREGGDVVIFDMSPWWPAWYAQKLAWNRARKVLVEKLDMFFWRDSALRRLAHGAFGDRKFQTQCFRVSPFFVFPPIFSLPKLKVPRFLYPFDIMMYRWSF